VEFASDHYDASSVTGYDANLDDNNSRSYRVSDEESLSCEKQLQRHASSSLCIIGE